jgi:hypothetical protein
MGEIGNGYGSECHLLRWMGRHRKEFDKRLLAGMKQPEDAQIEWLDFNFQTEPGKLWPDAELKGLEFLQGEEYRALQEKWAEFWPLGKGVHNWDAAGWLHVKNKRELLLLEAKAHIGEIKSDCGAEKDSSIDKIENAFKEVKTALHVQADRDWMKKYYQFTNRIATLYFLNKHNIAARLIFVYFNGDIIGESRVSPKTEDGWKDALHEQSEWVGLPEGHALEDRIHKVFLPIAEQQ